MILVGLEIGSLEDAGYPSDETFQYLLGFSAIFLCYAIIKVPSTGEMRCTWKRVRHIRSSGCAWDSGCGTVLLLYEFVDRGALLLL